MGSDHVGCGHTDYVDFAHWVSCAIDRVGVLMRKGQTVKTMSETLHRHQGYDSSLRGHPGPLRPVRRLLRGLPGSDAQVQLRVLHRPERHAVGGAGRERRSAPGSPRPQARHDPARGGVRLGADTSARHGEVRRQRHRSHPQQESAGVLRSVARQGRQRALRSTFGWRVGSSSAARWTASSRSRPSSTSASSVTTTSSSCAYDVMPDDGRMTIQSSVGVPPRTTCWPAARSSPSRWPGSSSS